VNAGRPAQAVSAVTQAYGALPRRHHNCCYKVAIYITIALQEARQALLRHMLLSVIYIQSALNHKGGKALLKVALSIYKV